MPANLSGWRAPTSGSLTPAISAFWAVKPGSPCPDQSRSVPQTHPDQVPLGALAVSWASQLSFTGVEERSAKNAELDVRSPPPVLHPSDGRDNSYGHHSRAQMPAYACAQSTG